MDPASVLAIILSVSVGVGVLVFAATHSPSDVPDKRDRVPTNVYQDLIVDRIAAHFAKFGIREGLTWVPTAPNADGWKMTVFADGTILTRDEDGNGQWVHLRRSAKRRLKKLYADALNGTFPTELERKLVDAHYHVHRDGRGRAYTRARWAE